MILHISLDPRSSPGNFVAPAKERQHSLAFLSQSRELLWTLNVNRYDISRGLKFMCMYIYACLALPFQKEKPHASAYLLLQGG